mgnify:CR=1 FL=1
MKINDLRTLIREEIQNELAEAKKKKKDEAKKKIMEIIAEAELTEEDLEEGLNLMDKLKTQYEEGSVIGDDAVKADAEAKIKAFMDEKGSKLDANTKKTYTDKLMGMISGIVAKAKEFKTPVIVKVEIAQGKPILTVGGAKAVKGVGSVFTGKGSTGGQTAYGE